MSTVDIREELHEMINQADERLLNLVYAMMSADLREQVLTDSQTRLLEERLEEYRKSPDSAEDWGDVMKELDAQ